MRTEKQSPGAEQLHKNPNGILHIPQKLCSLPIFTLPRGVHEKLLKVAAFMGIPAQILAASEVTKLVLRHWDRKHDRPQ